MIMVSLADDVVAWSKDTFGAASLGDHRHTRRLVSMAAEVARHPVGSVAVVFGDDAEREGAYRALGSEWEYEAIVKTAALAGARRTCGYSYFFAPIDGSSLNFKDRHGRKSELGSVGPRSKGARGLETMTALAVAPDGQTLDLLGLKLWARGAKLSARKKKARSFAQKESHFWLEVLEGSQEACRAAGTWARPWYQLDRGGDFKEALGWAAGHRREAWVTVRAAQDRLLANTDGAHLWSQLQLEPVLGGYVVDVLPGKNRTARRAHMEIRAAQVFLKLPVADADANVKLRVEPLGVVLAREVGTTPKGEAPLEWMLLTTAPMSTLTAAIEVVRGYSMRWRVEDFHKTWKSTYHVEDCQLDGGLAVWATLKATAAVRVERLKHLSRTAPETPATVELTQDEIDAVILLAKPKGFAVGDVPSLGVLVPLIARLGGWAGKYSHKPPGNITLGRGMDVVHAAAAAVAAMRGHDTPTLEPLDEM